MPAPPEGPPPTDDKDPINSSAAVNPTIIGGGFLGWFFNTIYRPIATGLTGLATTTGAVAGSLVGGFVALVYPRPVGEGSDIIPDTSNDMSVQVDNVTSTGQIHIDGAPTGINVKPTGIDENGIPTGYTPATVTDAEALSELTGTQISVGDTIGTSDAEHLEPAPVDTGSLDFPPFIETAPEDLTPEELALTYPDAPASEPLPETPTEAPVQASPNTTPPAVEAPVATVAAPDMPGVPPLTPPVVDNGPLVNPQPVADTGTTTMPGGSNDTGAPGTPGLTHTESDDSTPPSHVNDETEITILESREATDEEVEETISGLLETYPQYSEEELLEIATDDAQGGNITPNSLLELEAAVGAHANGVVTGDLLPAGNGNHDFRTVDEAGDITDWDVKSLNSSYPYNLDDFLTSTFDKDISEHGEQVVFNTVNMSPEDIAELEQALIDDPRFTEEMYVFYPAP